MSAGTLYFAIPTIVLFLILGGVTGCSGSGASGDPASSLADRRLPVPTKDEVFVVSGKSLSISGYMAMKAQLKSPSATSAEWVALATLALLGQADEAHSSLAPENALLLARYAFGDASLQDAHAALQAFAPSQTPVPAQELKARIDRRLARSAIQRNIRVLSELR